MFLPQEDFWETFDVEEDSYNGYFSDREITDIEDGYISTVITQEDLTKLSRQMEVSMGDFMVLFRYFGVIMFLLLMYLLTKQLIEKNEQSISMTKILGYTNGEIGGLYLAANTVVVVVSLALAAPICNGILKWMFQVYLYTEISGYIPYMVRSSVFWETFFAGIAAYVVVAAAQMYRIRKIPGSDALKNVE
jgi:putative ABC transport system permease protein